MFPWGVDRTLRFKNCMLYFLNPTPYRSLRRVALQKTFKKLSPLKKASPALSPADYPYLIDYYQSITVTLNAEVLPQNAWYH
jgi:hypothetical protein